MTVRAIFRVVSVPDAPAPYDRATLKIYYPARFTGATEERVIGIVGADSSFGAMPVIVFFNGANCSPEGYSWLATDLAGRGYVVITFTYVAEDLPGFPGLSSGIDISKVLPATFGSNPTSRLVHPILDALNTLNTDEKSLLKGLIDTDKVILGGHSAGGTVALHNARQDWFPSVIGAFGYAAHTVPAAMLGYLTGTVLPAGKNLPILLIEAEHDGVITASTGRYAEGAADAPIYKTFSEGGSADGSLLACVRGANHFSVMHPLDPTTGRGFLDGGQDVPGDLLREVIAEVVGVYCDHLAKSDVIAKQNIDTWLKDGHPWLVEIVKKVQS
jgi:dienelactone hydrolase